MKRTKTSPTGKSIETIKKQLAAMPEKSMSERNLTLKETVELLAKEISAMLGKGYTYKEVADKLKDQNIIIQPATLNNYHRAAVMAAQAPSSIKAKRVNATVKKPVVEKVQQVQVRVKTDAIDLAKSTKPKVKKPLGRPAVFKEIETVAKRPQTRATRKKTA